MSGKKEDGWIECSKCKKYFPKKSLHQHENACTLSEKDVNDKSSAKSQSGYIDKGMFFGKILKRATQKNEKVNEKRNIVTLNTSTIKALGLHLGSLVSLHLKCQHIVRTIWPSSKTPLDSIGIHESELINYKVSDSDTIILHGIVGVSCHANSVILTSCKPLEFDLTPQFSQYSTYYLGEFLHDKFSRRGKCWLFI